MDSPDTWMDKEIGDVILRCSQRVERLVKIDKMIAETQDPDRKELIRNTLAMNEIRMCQNIAVAIRARSKEVKEYAEKYLHLTGVEEADIKKNPWIICAVAGRQFDRICMLMDAQDAANGLPDQY